MKTKSSILSDMAALLAVTALVMPANGSQSITLEWDPSVDLNVVGYRVHYQETGATNEMILEAGNTNAFTLTGLAEGTTYSFYVTAYKSVGLESVPSNTLEYTVPLAPLCPSLARDVYGRPVLGLYIDAVVGKCLALETSTNLVDWAVILTASTGQPLDYRMTNVVADPRCFYRATVVP